MTLRTLRLSSLLPVGAALLLSACASSSPENFVEKAFELQCEFIEECDKDQWDLAGYDSVKDCRDDLLSLDVDGQSFTDAFVAECDDFDRSAARKCLKASRKQVKECTTDISAEDEKECMKVCGEPMTQEEESGTDPAPLMIDPSQQRFIIRTLEHLERTGQLDLEASPEDLEADR